MQNIVLLLIYVLGMVVGQILFKRVSSDIQGFNSVADLAGALFGNQVFYLAIFIYGLLTVYWIWLLRTIAISYAYPFVALSIAIMVALGATVWGERIGWLHIVGVGFVLIGVVIIGVANE